MAWALLFSAFGLIEVPGHRYSGDVQVIIVTSAIVAFLCITAGLAWNRSAAMGLTLEKIGHIFSGFTWGANFFIILWSFEGQFHWSLMVSVAFFISAVIKSITLQYDAKRYMDAYRVQDQIKDSE